MFHFQVVAQNPDVEFPSEFTTKKGVTLTNCKVKRVETDALIVEHDDGIAKVSFFDVSKELQDKHGFDPVAAMDKYRRDLKVQRDLKWKRFWEGQEHESKMAAREQREKFLKTAKETWIPIEADIQQVKSGGAYVAASRITFVPTKTKSALGFEIDGPPRKKLVPFQPRVIFIEAPGITGKKWLGYLEPTAHGTTNHPQGIGNDIPMYRAVARTEIK
ncbi:MAG: hypothetical protein P1V20_23585 [Verrucomicrobiales bacterium]|nr:hypothetical protein [Verrucomicrobiales bacterium]